uniref:Uncharacterized protein n=1 Tax=Anopheles atroparvus TaxID=41427 RepID=A0A182J6N1_ANOAO
MPHAPRSALARYRNVTTQVEPTEARNPRAANAVDRNATRRHHSDAMLVRLHEEDYDAFCLAYMFTYRDFEMGTLGLAWTGDLKNAGGVCEKNGMTEFAGMKRRDNLAMHSCSLKLPRYLIEAPNPTPKQHVAILPPCSASPGDPLVDKLANGGAALGGGQK